MNNADAQQAPNVKKFSYRWLRLGVFILIGLITPFALFYMSYYDESIGRQEHRVFRTLKELESAIDQTIGNLPFIHKKGLFPDISKLDKKISSLEGEIKNYENEIIDFEDEARSFANEIREFDDKSRELEESIKKSKGNRDNLIENIKYEKKNQKELIEKNKYRDLYEKKYLKGKHKTETDQINLASTFYQYENDIKEIAIYNNNTLNKIELCKGLLASVNKDFTNINKKTFNNIEEFKKYKETIEGLMEISNDISNVIHSSGCQVLSNNFKDNLYQYSLSVNTQATNLIKDIDSFIDEYVDKSEGKTKNIINNPLNDTKIDYFTDLFDDYLLKMAVIDSCIPKIIDTNDSTLNGFFNSLRTPNGLKQILDPRSEKNSNIEENKNLLIANKNNLLKIQSKCIVFKDEIIKYLDENISKYSNYIDFLNNLDDKLKKINKDIIETNSNKENFDKNKIKINSIIKRIKAKKLSVKLDEINDKLSEYAIKNSNYKNNKYKLIKNILDLKNDIFKKEIRKYQVEGARQSELIKKSESIKKDEVFKKTLEIIKQTPGFERIDAITDKHIEVSCRATTNNDIINLIRPSDNGGNMELITYDPKTIDNIKKHGAPTLGASHKHDNYAAFQVPTQIVINTDVKKLPIHSDQSTKVDSPPEVQSHKHDKHIHIQVPLQDVINAQVSALPTFFDQVLIADADGKIYYLSSPLNSGEKKQLGRFQYDPFSYDFIGYQNVKEILKSARNASDQSKKKVDGNDTSAKADSSMSIGADIDYQSKGISGLSRTRSIFVGDLEFRAFIQPINLPVQFCDSDNKEGNKKQWYLIGVINEDRFQKVALAAPPIVVGCAILLIVIALALLPFLKVILADRHTHIPKRLRSLVILCLAICCSFVTLLVCLLVSHHHLSDMNKRNVKDLNDDINRQFHDELAVKLSTFELQKRLFSEHINTQSFDQCLKDINNKSYKNYPLDQNKTMSPFYTFMILDDEGKHLGKINTVKTLYTSNDSSLENRAYFRNALNGNTWNIPFKNNAISLNYESLPETCDVFEGESNTSTNEYEIFIERIVSYLDGRRETIFSALFDKEYVAVMDVRLDTFFRRILPLHYSFAVVESNTGLVLFHSTPERALVENFIDETDGSSALIAKFYHQNKGHIKLTYQSQPIQAYVSPLLTDENEQVLWQLVTYKTLDLDENRLLMSTLTVACLILALYVCAFIVFKVIISVTHSLKSLFSLQYIINIFSTRNVLIVLFILCILVIIFTIFSCCNEQVLWQLVTYKALDLDENRLLMSTLTVACLILALFVCAFIVFKVIILVTHSLKSSTYCQFIINIFSTRNVLIILLILVIIFTIFSYCKVFVFFEAASEQYDGEYQKKELVYRKAGFKKIYNILDWDKIQGRNGMLKDNYINNRAGLVDISNIKSFSILSVKDKSEQIKKVLDFKSDCESPKKICFVSVVHERDENTWMISGLNSQGSFSSTFLDDSGIKLLDKLYKKLAIKSKSDKSNKGLFVKFNKELELANEIRELKLITSVLNRNLEGVINKSSKADLSLDLKYVLPVISYSTGVLVENLENTGINSDKVIKILFWFIWGIFIVGIYMIIRYAVDKVVTQLFDGVNPQSEDITDKSSSENVGNRNYPPINLERLIKVLFSRGEEGSGNDKAHKVEDSGKGSETSDEESYVITTSSTYAKNVILLSINPEELLEQTKDVREEINKEAKVVVIDTIDKLALCHNVYPEGSVVFVTDFASLLIQRESSQKLLVLLEAFTALRLQVVIVSNIVPGYWLKIQEQRVAQGSVNDAGIDVEIYRWSILLEKFNVISINDLPENSVISTVNITNSKYSKFHNQWALCSFEEHSVLTSLADKDLVNIHNSEAIESLFFKGLIERDPNLIYQQQLKIKNSAFVDFIHDHFHKTSIDAWRNQGSGQLWHAVLPVFLVLTALVTLFLVRTGTEALQYSLSVLAGLVAAIPALSTVLGYFKNKP